MSDRVLRVNKKSIISFVQFRCWNLCAGTENSDQKKKKKIKIGYFNQSRPKCEHSVLKKKNRCVYVLKTTTYAKILHTIFFLLLFSSLYAKSTSSEKVIYLLCRCVSFSRAKRHVWRMINKYIFAQMKHNTVKWYIDRSF